MTSKPHYISTKKNSQVSRQRLSCLSDRNRILQTGCRGRVAGSRVVYLATVLDQFAHLRYEKAHQDTRTHFPVDSWAMFEPARCSWTSKDWLSTWPRLLCWIDALVIWPRPDASVGYGVYQEACDIQCLGRPIYVLSSGGTLKSFRGFRLYTSRSRARYARVQVGKSVRSAGFKQGQV